MGQDSLLDSAYGIVGAGDHSGDRWIEHVEIIVAVANGETLVGTEFVDCGHFLETAALLESSVTEAEVNGVPLPAKARIGGCEGSDTINDPVHLFTGAGDDAGRIAARFDPQGAGVLFNFFANGGQDLARAFEEALNLLFAAFVPAGVRQPATEIIGEIDFPFACYDEIGEKRETTFDEAIDHLSHGAPCIDAPNDLPGFPEFPDEGEEIRWNRRARGRIVEGPVEIEGKDA